MDREKLIKSIMKECEADGEPVTRAEAEAMADMELKSKDSRNYVQSEKPKKSKSKKERKVDTDKAKLLKLVARGLEMGGIADISQENEVKLHFKSGGNAYTITLTRHKADKG